MLSCDQQLFSRTEANNRSGGVICNDNLMQNYEPQLKRVRVGSVQLQSNNAAQVEELSIDDLTRECIGRGRSGSVYKVTLNNTMVACKLYDTYKSGNSERMMKELGVYQRLKRSQGVLIPRVLSRVFMDGEIVGVCLTLLRPLPWKLSLWSKEDRYKAKGVLLKLADVGLFHDDIKTDNFGLTPDNRMMVFDFEDVTCIEDLPAELDVQKYTTRYKKRVCRMFKDNK